MDESGKYSNKTDPEKTNPKKTSSDNFMVRVRVRVRIRVIVIGY